MTFSTYIVQLSGFILAWVEATKQMCVKQTACMLHHSREA